MNPDKNPNADQPQGAGDDKSPTADKTQGGDKNQGEGNIEASRRYDEAQKRFVESGKVERAARDAATDSPEQAEQLRRAEEEGKSHAKK